MSTTFGFRNLFHGALAAFILAASFVAPAFAAAAAEAPAVAIPAADAPVAAIESKVIRDLYKQYEIWQNQGIRFVVRNEHGQFVTWGIGQLESWNGTRTVVCVRGPKGTFLTWAKGKIETWRGDAKRYVFRDKKGHFLQWAPLDLTSAATFGENLDRLFKISPADSKHFPLLVEVIHESIVADLEAGRTEKAFRFASAAFAQAADPKQREKIAAVLKPVLAWLKPAMLHSAGDGQMAELYETCRDLSQMTM